MSRNRFAITHILALALALAGCSGAETKRIASEAVKGTMRSACADAGNCTQDCGDGARVPPGAKCAEKP